jgi:hypothetical protein
VSYITIGSIAFPSNYLSILIFLGYVLKNVRREKRFCWLPVKYYVVFFVGCAVFATFSWNFSLCLGIIKSDLISMILIPFVLTNIAKFDDESWRFVKKILLVSIVISVAYGLFLIPLKGMNPYTIELKKLVGGTGFSENWLMEEGRIFGRITGTFAHPMYYANFLLYSFLYVLYLCVGKKERKIKLLALVILFCLMTCGVRSGIMALMGVFAFFCLRTRKTKTFVYIGALIIVLLVCSVLFPSFFEYISSPFFPDESSSTRGSSFSMRIEQFAKSLDVISGRELFGMGYGWTTWYMQVKTIHPYLLGFESLVLKLVCEGGLLGILLFVWLYKKMYGLKIQLKHNKLFCELMITAYLCYTLFTGDYLYSVYFLLFYSMIYGDYIRYLYGNDKKIDFKR